MPDQRFARHVVLEIVGVLFLGACGAAPVGPGSPGPATRTPATVTAAGGTAYPVVVSRVGGVAGFRDRVTFLADASVRIEPTRGAVRGCRLTAFAASAVEAGRIAQVGHPDRSVPAQPTDPTHPDELVLLIALPGRDPSRLLDPVLGALVDRLLDPAGTPECTAVPGGTG